jgi:hypothetical protein
VPAGFLPSDKIVDLLIVNERRLVAALELKSQVGPSFGNNFNNRTEEAIGTAVDLWTALREGAFGEAPRPFGPIWRNEETVAGNIRWWQRFIARATPRTAPTDGWSEP